MDFPSLSDDNSKTDTLTSDGVITMTEDVTTAQDPQDDTVALDDIVEEGELTDEEIVSRTILYAFDQGIEMLEQSGGFDPFTVVVSDDELYIEEQPGETEEESYASARRTVFQMERLCDAYAFCYDGYVNLEDGESDAIIVEWARKGDGAAQTLVKLYHRHGDHLHFDEELYQVGEAESLFSPSSSTADDGTSGDVGSDRAPAPSQDDAPQPPTDSEE
jgi:hypothetical protein